MKETYSLVLQVILVLLVSSVFTMWTASKNYLSPINLIWMILFPVLIGVLMNPRFRFKSSLLLVVTSLSAQMLVATYLGLFY